MSYDITMCRCACSRARTCHRWLQFRRYLKDDNPNKPRYVSMHTADGGQIDETCSAYFEEKKEGNQ